MSRLIKTLNSVSETKNPNTADYINALKDNFPNQTKQGINLLKSVWDEVIRIAPLKYSRNWNRLFEALDKALKNIYPNENTMEKNLSAFRKPLRHERFDKEIYKNSIYKMGITRERSIQKKEEYKNKVKVRNAGRKDLPVIYVEDILELINKLIQSSNVYDLVLAVELATGSRSIEVLSVSQYERTPDSSEIKVIGLAKDKGNNNLQNVHLIRNLNGLNSKQVIDAVAKIRNELKFNNLTNQEISDKSNKILNRKFKKLMVEVLPKNKEYARKLTAHKTRYIAGNVSYLLYGEPRDIPYESYLQEQYGHLSGESTKSYLGINIKMRKKSLKVDDELIKKVEELDLKVGECCDEKKEEIEFKTYANGNAEKIQAVVDALKELKEKKQKMSQRDLRKKLGFSASVLTAGYKKARDLKVI